MTKAEREVEAVERAWEESKEQQSWFPTSWSLHLQYFDLYLNSELEVAS